MLFSVLSPVLFPAQDTSCCMRHLPVDGLLLACDRAHRGGVLPHPSTFSDWTLLSYLIGLCCLNCHSFLLESK